MNTPVSPSVVANLAKGKSAWTQAISAALALRPPGLGTRLSKKTTMADRCAGCLNKFRLFEKPSLCPSCHRNFCSTCLPVPKKQKKRGAHPPPRETCVYCTREQKDVIRSEEAEVIETFQERFYKHAHTEPPIQTRTQLDLSKVARNEGGGRGGGGRVESNLSDEDKQLEERLRKLKESRKVAAPEYSEEEIREKLAKLRGKGSEEGTRDTGPPSSAGRPPPGKTQFQETQDLFKKASEEAKLDEQLAETNRKKDENLSNRLQVLKGMDSSTFPPSGSQQFDVDIQQLLEGIEIEMTEESPEQLLKDLQETQRREEEGRQAAGQTVDPAGKGGTNSTESLPSSDIPPYPILPGTVGLEESGGVSESAVSKLVEHAAVEIKCDQEREERDKLFIENASEQLAKLRGDEGGNELTESDCVVRSKPTGPRGSRSGSHTLSFTWEHFGASPGLLSDPAADLAARQLGITLSMDGGDDVSDDEVSTLLGRMMEEATLDKKLEMGGYGSYLEGQTSQPEASRANDPEPKLKSGGGGEGGGASLAAAYQGDDGDLPWCCICNNDANIRCYDCDDDLYCSRCFSEGHETFGLFDHRYAPYEPPSQNQV